ncbi:MAG: hypothetical protein E6L03_01305 [Thaumarchaeota archaeon]|nr:MAG: hypothetical protein E6L03_01305 [Nitrososphaerota archaeon]
MIWHRHSLYVATMGRGLWRKHMLYYPPALRPEDEPYYLVEPGTKQPDPIINKKSSDVNKVKDF